MAVTIKLRQGTKAQSTSLTGLVIGEPLYCDDTQELFIATGAEARAPAAIDIDAYSGIGSVNTSDLIYMYDVSADADAVKARKITFGDFKTALSIPETSTDEKVALTGDSAAGYLGTTDDDGVLRAGAGIGLSPGNNDAYIEIDLSFASEAQGDIIYRGATDWARLAAASTSGSFLQSNGSGSNPSWQDTVDGGSFAA